MCCRPAKQAEFWTACSCWSRLAGPRMSGKPWRIPDLRLPPLPPDPCGHLRGRPGPRAPPRPAHPPGLPGRSPPAPPRDRAAPLQLVPAAPALGTGPVRRLFERVVRLLATPQTPGAFYPGWRLLVLDGTVYIVPDSSAPAAGRAATAPSPRAANSAWWRWARTEKGPSGPRASRDPSPRHPLHAERSAARRPRPGARAADHAAGRRALPGGGVGTSVP